MFESIVTGFWLIVKFPMRSVCHKKGDHDWRWHGGGFLFSPQYPFTCKRCGIRSNGSIDDLKKKGFKGTARIN
jgi:hypothetical protein